MSVDQSFSVDPSTESVYTLVGDVEKMTFICCPKKWTHLLYGLAASLCLLNFILASTWNYGFGIGFSAIFMFIFSVLVGLNMYDKLCISGSACWKLFIQMCLIFVAIWVTLMIIIHCLGGTPEFEGSLPLTCDKHGCTRVASVGEVTRAGLTNPPPKLSTSFEGAMSIIVDHMNGLPFTQIEELTDSFARFRTLSALIGFPDDTGFELHCTNSSGVGQVEVWMMAANRLGEGDFGVNDDRILGLLDFLNTHTFIPGTCEPEFSLTSTI